MERQTGSAVDPQSDPGASADAALDQIDRLIGRINSTSSIAATMPLATEQPASALPQADENISASVTVPTATPVHRSGPHDDEALRDYMDQFLERVTGKKKEPEGPRPGAVAAEIVAISEPEKPREIKRGTESPQDLSMMRELANKSARRRWGACGPAADLRDAEQLPRSPLALPDFFASGRDGPDGQRGLGLEHARCWLCCSRWS